MHSVRVLAPLRRRAQWLSRVPRRCIVYSPLDTLSAPHATPTPLPSPPTVAGERVTTHTHGFDMRALVRSHSGAAPPTTSMHVDGAVVHAWDTAVPTSAGPVELASRISACMRAVTHTLTHTHVPAGSQAAADVEHDLAASLHDRMFFVLYYRGLKQADMEAATASCLAALAQSHTHTHTHTHTHATDVIESEHRPALPTDRLPPLLLAHTLTHTSDSTSTPSFSLLGVVTPARSRVCVCVSPLGALPTLGDAPGMHAALPSWASIAQAPGMTHFFALTHAALLSRPSASEGRASRRAHTQSNALERVTAPRPRPGEDATSMAARLSGVCANAHVAVGMCPASDVPMEEYVTANGCVSAPGVSGFGAGFQTAFQRIGALRPQQRLCMGVALHGIPHTHPFLPKLFASASSDVEFDAHTDGVTFSPLTARQMHVLPSGPLHASGAARPAATLPATLPVFLLNELVVPQQRIYLHIFEPRYRLLMERHLKVGSQFAMLAPSHNTRVAQYYALLERMASLPADDASVVDTGAVATVLPDISVRNPWLAYQRVDPHAHWTLDEVATLGTVVNVIQQADDGRLAVEVQGGSRVLLNNMFVAPGTFGLVHGVAREFPAQGVRDKSAECRELAAEIRDLWRSSEAGVELFRRVFAGWSPEMVEPSPSMTPAELSWWLARVLPVPAPVRKWYLDCPLTADRLARQLSFLRTKLEIFSDAVEERREAEVIGSTFPVPGDVRSDAAAPGVAVIVTDGKNWSLVPGSEPSQDGGPHAARS